jgi:hypothetical protein
LKVVRFMTFFSKKILEELHKREEELSSEKFIQANTIDDVLEHLSNSRPAETTSHPAGTIAKPSKERARELVA